MHHSFLWVLQPSVLADGGPNSRVSIKGGARRLGCLGLKEEAARKPRLQVLSVGTQTPGSLLRAYAQGRKTAIAILKVCRGKTRPHPHLIHEFTVSAVSSKAFRLVCFINRIWVSVVGEWELGSQGCQCRTFWPSPHSSIRGPGPHLK